MLKAAIRLVSLTKSVPGPCQRQMSNYFKGGSTSGSRRRRPATRQGDPGVRGQVKLLGKDETLSMDDLEEVEADFNSFDNLHDQHHRHRKNDKELARLKNVRRKYFPDDSTGQNTLTAEQREQLRHLHRSDPSNWTVAVLAEHFNIDPGTAKKIIKANWLPSQKLTKAHNKSTLPAGAVKPGSYSEQTMTIEDGLAPLPKTVAKQHITWSQLTGTAMKPPPLAPAPFDFECEQSSDLTKIPKWADSGPQMNQQDGRVYYFDNKLGYQHPFGKVEEIELGPQQTVKEGELYRRGDCFYNEDGEFLYRVPGLFT